MLAAQLCQKPACTTRRVLCPGDLHPEQKLIFLVWRCRYSRASPILQVLLLATSGAPTRLQSSKCLRPPPTGIELRKDSSRSKELGSGMPPSCGNPENMWSEVILPLYMYILRLRCLFLRRLCGDKWLATILFLSDGT